MLSHPDVRRCPLTRRRELDGIDSSALPHQDQVSAEILRRDLADRVADVEFGTYQIPWNTDSGFHSEFAFLPAQTSFATADGSIATSPACGPGRATWRSRFSRCAKGWREA